VFPALQLNFGRANKEIEKQAGKPIMWASQFDKEAAKKRGKK
jgi:hypothetical protein